MQGLNAYIPTMCHNLVPVWWYVDLETFGILHEQKPPLSMTISYNTISILKHNLMISENFMVEPSKKFWTLND